MKKSLPALLMGLLAVGDTGAHPPATGCDAAAHPPRVEDWQFIVNAHGQGHFSLFLSETAESYLGREVFDSLAERFASIPGVDSVEHQDRESFVIDSRTLTSGQLKRALWGGFVAAASDACRQH